jgi:hypothetical protein
MSKVFWLDKVKPVHKGGLPSIDEIFGWQGAIPSWDGDNAEFVVEYVLPRLSARPEVVQVLRWAYGYDGSLGSFEKCSDGSSVVPNVWLGGSLKEPYGVGHDMIFLLHRCGLPTPDGHHWTLWEANLWYYRAMVDFGLPIRAVIRWVGLALFSWFIWTGVASYIFGQSMVDSVLQSKQRFQARGIIGA